VDKVIIVCPSSLVKNWANEYQKWLHGRVPTMPIASGTRDEITKKLQTFISSTGRTAIPILIISYETLRGHADTMCKGKVGLVICDEVSPKGGGGGKRRWSGARCLPY
jgi:DNA repair and recombination RAD54-like protein